MLLILEHRPLVPRMPWLSRWHVEIVSNGMHYWILSKVLGIYKALSQLTLQHRPSHLCIRYRHCADEMDRVTKQWEYPVPSKSHHIDWDRGSGVNK